MSQQQLPNNYHAIELARFGDTNELELVSRQHSLLALGQIRVKNFATSINPIDYKTRQGLGWAAQENADKLPMILGYDVVGVVVEVGDGELEFSVGDAVIGFVGFPLQAGCYSEFVIATGDELVKIDRHYNALASLPLAGLTAYQGLFEHGKLMAGEQVLISGASGGVGYLAVQLALNAGAKVIAIAGEANHKKLLALGDVIVMNYVDIDRFKALDNIDLWFDLIGGDSAVAQLSAAPCVQRVVTVPTITRELVCGSVAHKTLSATGMLVHLDKKQLTILARAVENNDLRLNIAKYMDLSQASQAHQLAESAVLSGKIVLTNTP